MECDSHLHSTTTRETDHIVRVALRNNLSDLLSLLVTAECLIYARTNGNGNGNNNDDEDYADDGAVARTTATPSPLHGRSSS